jgi:hypothetical protein
VAPFRCILYSGTNDSASDSWREGSYVL